MVNEKPKTISEHVMEVRYTPNPKLLDYVGAFADKLKELMGVYEWRTTSNRVDVYDKDNNLRVFVSFKNAGIIFLDADTKNIFPGQATKLLNFLFKQDSFGKKVFITRVGVRARFATGFQGTFDELLQHFKNRYFDLSAGATGIFAGNITDIGGPINFETKIGKLNTSAGPMKVQQLQEFFPNHPSVPEVGLYVDLDYWKRPETEFAVRDVISLIKKYSDEMWSIHENIRKLIIE